MGEEPNLELPDKKQCAVCGDHALCYNFNAVTCESCKAFFRRNATKDKVLKCAFKNVCEITRVTRRFCQSCRLKKCYQVGMKRELILTDSQKELKKRKIEVNKSKAMNIKSPTADSPVSVFSQSQFDVPFTQVSPGIEPIVQSAGDASHPLLVVSFPDPVMSDSFTQTTTALQVDSSVQTDRCCCSCSCESQASVSPVSKSEDSLSSSHLKLLENLIVANEALEAPVDQEVANLPGDEFMNCGGRSGLLDIINLTAVAIRRLIKMCKRITGFRSLCQQDQVSLLKQGCTQMMLLRSVLTFDPDRNSWKIPHTVDQLSRIKVEVLKEARGNLYEAHQQFLLTFDRRAAKDKYLIPILTAIALFDPSRPNLVHTNTIKEQQECYLDLLKTYLDKEYGETESKQMFEHLISKLNDLHRINEEHIRVYLNVNPSQVEPLLIEIFDLKTH